MAGGEVGGGAGLGGAAGTSGGGGTAGGGGASAGSGGASAGSGGASAGAGSGGGGGGSGGGSSCAPEFTNWPSGKSPQQIGALLTTNYLARARGAYHYSDACAWYGALGFTKATGDTARNTQLVTNFDQYLSGAGYIPTGTTVDDRVGGIVPLEIFIQTRDTTKNYLSIGRAPADAQYNEYNPDLNRARHWIDDMFMITALQVQASRASGDVKYRDYLARQMLNYYTTLQQTNGLFWHTRESHVHWGRGNGWCAVGMAELLQDLPAGQTRDQVMAGYLRMMTALRTNQIQQGQTGAGLWRQVIDYPQSWAETSATAMFVYSIATGVRNGWLPAADYASVARNGWLALTGELETDGDLTEVCIGTGAASVGTDASQRQFYLDRPRSVGDLHGQAPVIWAATTLYRACQ